MTLDEPKKERNKPNFAQPTGNQWVVVGFRYGWMLRWTLRGQAQTGNLPLGKLPDQGQTLLTRQPSLICLSRCETPPGYEQTSTEGQAAPK